MARCDQCYIDGGISVGRRPPITDSAKYEIKLLGAKMKVCEAHRKRFERTCEKRKIEFKYHELKEEK